MIRKLFALAPIAASLLLSATASAGRSSPGIEVWTNPSDASCAVVPFGTSMVTNLCTNRRLFLFPAPVDNAGTKTVRILARSNTVGKNILCSTLSTGPAGTFWGGQGNLGSRYGFETDIVISGSVPVLNNLTVVCDVDAGGQIISYNWNQ